MAHFFAPDHRTDGYDVDGKLAPDSVWRMRILTGQQRVIGLWGGQNLRVQSNNEGVVPNDGFMETISRSDGLRMLTLLGKIPGTSMLECRLDGNLWCSLQVNVIDADLSPNPVNDDRRFDFSSPEWNVFGNFEPEAGSIPAGVGIASITRIPIPGTNNLVLELSSRGYKGSTSTVFIWERLGGKNARHLRLDYDFNKATNTVDYHWNRKGPAKEFWGIKNHQTVGEAGESLYNAAKYLKWGGRVLLVVGLTMDAISIATASNPLRRASQAVAGWAMAWVGCKTVGAFGAGVGTGLEPGIGTAVGGVVGCIIGGAAAYYAGSEVAADVYDWVEGTVFTPLPETAPQ
jgi:hypothetical protein